MTRKSKNLVGERVAEARKKAGLTQAELSARVEKAGIKLGRAGIAKLEVGIRQVADYEVVALAKALGVSEVSLLRGRR